MNIYKPLLAKDVRLIGKDPVFVVSVLGPLLLCIMARYGFPAASSLTDTYYSVSLEPYRGFTGTLFVVVIPMLAGMLTGLMILDERDEAIIAYYAVTPLRRSGYLLYRLLLPTAFSLLLSCVFLAGSRLLNLQWASVFAIPSLALEAPLFGLFLAAYAANKVEGLALSKIGGLFIAGPAVANWVPGTWQILGCWLPTYSPAKALLMADERETLRAFTAGLIGLFFHALLLRYVIAIFLKRQT